MSWSDSKCCNRKALSFAIYDKPHHFVRSEWPCMTAKVFLAYRIIIATYLVFGWFYHISMKWTFLWPAYLSTITLTLQMVTFIYKAVLVTLHNLQYRKLDNDNNTRPKPAHRSTSLPIKYRVMWAMSTLTADSALVVTVAYWSFVYPGVACPEKYFGTDTECFRYIDHQEDWHSGRDACKQLGADIASIHTKKHSSYIWEVFLMGQKSAWIGLTYDNAQNVTLTWADKSKVKFHLLEANTSSGHKEACTIMLKRWRLVSCDEKHGVMCKTPAVTLTYTSLHIHVFNSIIVLIDIFVSALPYWFSHIYVAIVYGVCYLNFTLIWYGAGQPNLYGILDWGNPARTIFTSVIILAALIPLHFMIWSLSKVRIRLQEECLISIASEGSVAPAEEEDDNNIANETAPTTVLKDNPGNSNTAVEYSDTGHA